MQRMAKLSVGLWGCVIALVGMANGQTNNAMLFTSGKVTLNGVAVGGSTSIFTGDKLDTADSSVAFLNRRGASVKVNQNSSVEYKESAVEIIHGAANVQTSNGMAARVGEFTVVPSNGKADFEIVRANNEVSVTSREGALTVTDGRRVTTLGSGTATSFAVKPAGGQSTSASGVVAADGSGTPITGPFYTIRTPADIPVCATALLCKRPNVSEIRPCVCKP